MYSVPEVGNRCHLQTKEHNACMWLLYQQQLQEEYEAQQQLLLLAEAHPADQAEVFPTVLLLMIDNEPWEEQPQRWEPHKPVNDEWINHLIED